MHCYTAPGKRKGEKIAKAFAEGAGAQALRPGAAFCGDDAFFYGMTNYPFAVREAALRAGVDWYYADNSYYFGRGVYFRVTRNGWQTSGTGKAGPDRFRRFGLTIQPWRREGYILIATQSDLFYRMFESKSREQWLKMVTETIRLHTDRPIRVALKPEPKERAQFPHGPFEQLIDGAYALVTHSSSCAVGAILRGVPVFCTASCAADPVASGPLSRIEAPYYPEHREQWLWNLAASQWTRSEMASGKCWRDLQERALVPAE